MKGAVEFDLSQASDLHYRASTRTPRLLAAAGSIGLPLALIYRLIISGLPAWLIPVYIVVGALAVFCIWAATEYFAPGPTRLMITPTTLQFAFRTGKTITVSTHSVARELGLVEFRRDRFKARFPPMNDVDHIAVVRASRYPLSPAAFDAIRTWIANAGFRTVERPVSPASRGFVSFRFSDSSR